MNIIYHHRTRGEDAQGIHIQALQDAWSQLGHRLLEVSLGRKPRGEDSAPAAISQHSEGRGRIGSLIYEGLTLGYNIYGYWKLSSAIKSFKPALIYERYCLNLIAGAIAARRFKIPFVLEVNSPLVDELSDASGLAGRRLARWCERFVFRHATRVVVVTDVLRRHYERQGIDTSKFQVIHNGIDPSRFNLEVDPAPVRAEYGLENRCVIGFVGWARQWHRLDLLIDAYANLSERDQFAVLICGDGPAIPGLREKAAAMGIAGNVHFAGALDHSRIPAHIAAMDIAVLPSIPVYASPMKLFEYMAMGKAVVVPDQPNLREIITDGVNGLLVSADEQHGLAIAVTRLALDDDLRTRLSRRAAETIRERGYYWTRNAERVLQGVGL